MRLCFNLKVKTVVFDGYTPSTKDAMRHGRSGKVSQLVKIHDENQCLSDRKNFYRITQTKICFVIGRIIRRRLQNCLSCSRC